MNLEKICRDARALIVQVGGFIRQEQKKLSFEAIEVKGKHNYVTYVDKTSERKLVDGLEKLVPDAGFITEEGTSTKKSAKYNWVIDPLDGTTNFIHGLPPYAISVALLDRKKVILGIVYEVCMNECYYAWEGSKAYMNDVEISSSKTSTVEQSLIAMGFPYTDFNRLEPFVASLKYYMQNSHGVRRIGSAATDLAYVAAGRFDAFYEYGLNSWDVAAGVLILQQAGGMITDFNGGSDYIFGKEIVASNSIIHDELLQIVNKFMVKREYTPDK